MNFKRFQNLVRLRKRAALSKAVAFACKALVYCDIRDKLGQSVLFNYPTGKYHRSVEEDRIFMFLDMKSSTAFAESLAPDASLQIRPLGRNALRGKDEKVALFTLDRP
jgi:hypothetical protein